MFERIGAFLTELDEISSSYQAEVEELTLVQKAVEIQIREIEV